jgi:hypothetical protein
MDSASSKDNITNGVGVGVRSTEVDEFPMIGLLFLDQKMGNFTKSGKACDKVSRV